jgi:hypothetical protein
MTSDFEARRLNRPERLLAITKTKYENTYTSVSMILIKHKCRFPTKSDIYPITRITQGL